MKRSVIGGLTAFATMGLLTALTHALGIAAPALVLVISLVVGAFISGRVIGATTAIAAFLAFDVVFVASPFHLSGVESAYWALLGAFVVVMLVVAATVDRLRVSRARERRRRIELGELLDISELLIGDAPLERVLDEIAGRLSSTFGASQVAILLPARDDQLQARGSAGPPLRPDQLAAIADHWRTSAWTETETGTGTDDLVLIPLVATATPEGMLALSSDGTGEGNGSLRAIANQISLAAERSRLRDQELRMAIADEVHELAKVLVAAVSHDLRAPLACIKASSSVLADPHLDLGRDTRLSLACLIDGQSDRLDALVQNLLDMSRVQAGVLEPQLVPSLLAEVVGGAVTELGVLLADHHLVIDVPDDLPLVSVDPVMIGRSVVNVLANAARHGPRGTDITVTARQLTRARVELSVSDCGIGVHPEHRQAIFGLREVRRPSDAGAGIGLTIARTFVEAHGEEIRVEDAVGGGARFSITLPVSTSSVAEYAHA